MEKEYQKKLTDFVSEYISIPREHFEAPGIARERVLHLGVLMLITEGVFTPEEIKAEALRKYRIIIPEHYFSQDDYCDKYGG